MQMNRTNLSFSKWLPVIFLLFVWYVPRNTAPGGFLEKYIILRWSTYFIIPLIILLFVGIKLRYTSKIRFTYLIFPILSLLFIILFSGWINGSSLLNIAFAILTYLRYPLLFIVLLNINLDEYDLKLFLKAFFFLLIIQIPETFYRYFALGIKCDHISWTMGPWGHSALGIYMIYATALLVSRSLIIKMKLSYLVLILCFFSIALFGEIKAFTFLTPLVAGFTICICLLKGITRKKLYVAAAILICLLAGFVLDISLYEKVFPKSGGLKQIRTALYLEKQGEQEKKRKISRISGFIDVLSQPEIKLSEYLFGWGPGSSLAGNYVAERGKIFDMPITHKNQLSETFVDVGFLGMLAYYWFLFCLLIQFQRHLKLEKDETYIFLNRALLGIWLFYVFLGPVYGLVWRQDYSQYIFFFLSAILYKRYYQIIDLKGESSIN